MMIMAYHAFHHSALVYTSPQDTTNFAVAYPAWYELLELYNSTCHGTEEHAFQLSLPLLAIEFDQAFKSQAMDMLLEHTLGTKEHSPVMSSLVALEHDPTKLLHNVFTHLVSTKAIWNGCPAQLAATTTKPTALQALLTCMPGYICMCLVWLHPLCTKTIKTALDALIGSLSFPNDPGN
ncbi:hypothetical protein BC828DRAFT_434216 [Blastocladiella britannica]|nr:hypothetical protein BC828DRAFT_434216 [Blastocladiella britannica]